MKPLYEPSAIAAAKVVAAHKGDKGRVGGWIYTPAGRPIVQGWAAYADDLERWGHIAAGVVTGRDGKPVTRYAINWRRVT